MGKGRGRAVVSHPGAEDRTDALKHLIIQMTSGVGGEADGFLSNSNHGKR